MKTEINPSVLTKSQRKTFGPRFIASYGKDALITATVRYDDQCGNGHNTFAITAEVVTPASRRHDDCEACGMLHDDVARIFPELTPLLKWHLCSSDGPMHYVADSLYWAGRKEWGKLNLKTFRSTAIWPDATEQDMKNATEESLSARLPSLLAEFRAAVESLGFVY